MTPKKGPQRDGKPPTRQRRIDVGLGDYLRQARLAVQGSDPKMASIEDFAAKANITPQYWKMLENGQWPENASRSLLEGLALALNRPYAELWLKAYEKNIPEGLAVVARTPITES